MFTAVLCPSVAEWIQNLVFHSVMVPQQQWRAATAVTRHRHGLTSHPQQKHKRRNAVQFYIYEVQGHATWHYGQAQEWSKLRMIIIKIRLVMRQPPGETPREPLGPENILFLNLDGRLLQVHLIIIPLKSECMFYFRLYNFKNTWLNSWVKNYTNQ